MVKNLPAYAGDPGLIPGLGRSPGEGNGTQLHQHSCLENPMDKGAWQATVHGKPQFVFDWLFEKTASEFKIETDIPPL